MGGGGAGRGLWPPAVVRQALRMARAAAKVSSVWFSIPGSWHVFGSLKGAEDALEPVDQMSDIGKSVRKRHAGRKLQAVSGRNGKCFRVRAGSSSFCNSLSDAA
jgi:hypothetical protein